MSGGGHSGGSVPPSPNSSSSSSPPRVTTHLMGLTSCGGLPLFTRKKGDGEPLPFSTVASLNGVYMFGKSQSVTLKSTSTESGTVVWREFENSITLIVAASGTSENELAAFLQTVFDALVLLVGIAELREPRNAERLKRELRVCYPLLDRLLSCIHPSGAGERVSSSGAELAGMTECTLCQENQVLQAYLEEHVEALGSLHGCVLLHGRVAVATPAWWALEARERALLVLLVAIDSGASYRDLPVFLPDKSPEVPFRLVTVRLVPGVEVLTLCGPTPALGEAGPLTAVVWRHAGDVLRALAVPRTLPPNFGLDRNVLGLLLVHTAVGKFVLVTDPHGEAREGRVPSHAHRAAVLHAFHARITAAFIPNATTLQGSAASSSAETPHRARESYWCSEFHKCHALLSPPCQLFVLYAAAVPTAATRAISKHTLKLLNAEKMFCW